MEIMNEESAAKDIRSALTVMSTPPEEAAKNIDRANLFEISPDSYSGLKEQLEPDAIAIERTPATIEPETQKYISQSEQHASLASQDLDKLNAFEKRARFYKQKIFDIPEMQREANEIVAKKMDSPDGKIDEGEEAYLQDLNIQMREMESSAESYGIGKVENFAVDVASAAGDFIRSYWENKEILAGSIGAGAVIGGGIGAVTPVPGAAIVGLGAGAIKGAIGGSMLVGFIDGYQQTSRSLYNELSQSTDEQGQPIPHERMANVSRAVGVISGVASGLAGKVFASNNAFMKRFLTPKSAAKYVMNPAVMAKMEILGGIAKSAFAEGGEEMVQDLTQIIGENFAKMDESEASFMNAIENSLNSETLKRVAYSGAVGAATGGLMQTVTSAPGYPGLKKRFKEVEEVTNHKKQVLEAQNNMIELANDIKETNMKKLSPGEMSNFQKKVFSSLGVDEDVWFHLEDLREFSNSPEKGAALRKVIDPSGEMTKMSQELNIPIKVNKGDVLDIIADFPEITDYMRLTPDGENPLAIRNEGKEFASRLDQAEQRRAALQETLGLEPLTPEQESQLRKDITDPVKESKYFNSRESYLGQSAIQPIQGVVNTKDAEKLSTIQTRARLAIDKSLVDVVDARFERYAKAEFKVETEQEIASEINKLKKEYDVIENFSRTKNLTDVDLEYTKSHGKKGFSSFAIDPNSLSVAQRAIYFDNNDVNPSIKKNMKARKVFVDGGLKIEEAAALQGLESGDELLRILGETPTKKQIETRIKNDPLRNSTRPDEISDSMEATKLVARDEAFTGLINAHLDEAKFIAANEYPTHKRGFIKIAKKPKPTPEVIAEAKGIIRKMKIRDINPDAFKRGEQRSHQASIEQFADTKYEQAFDSKERAALNTALWKEALNAQDKVERFQKFWKRATSESNLQELRDAGMSSTMEEFMSLYKLDGNVRGETEQKSFNAFIKRQAELGNFVPAVPDRLDNTQASFKDLTVEQYQTMTEMGQFILDQAKKKNKFLKQAQERNELHTAETVAEEIDTLTNNHPSYDKDRAERKNEKYLSVTESWKEGLNTTLSAFSSVKSIVLELDNYQLDGLFHRIIGKPIKESRTNFRKEALEFAKRDQEIFEKFYGKDVEQIYSFINVPEFADIPSLGDGRGNIRKSDLLVIQAYMGDPGGREAIPNFTDRQGNQILSVESMQAILDRTLDEKDVNFAQNLLNDRFKPLAQRSVDLHKRTAGVDADLVEGVPTVHRGKVRPGGYYPLRYQILQDEVRASNMLADIKDEVISLGMPQEGHFYARMASAGMTQQGRLKERTGSQRPLDVSFENFIGFTNEALHDLHFRETGIDILKVLKNPLNVKNMKAVVGPKKFVALLNGVKDVVSKTTERESTLFGDQQAAINKWIDKAHSLHAMKTIGFNVTSAAIQPSSLTNLLMRVGPETGVYLVKHAMKISMNLAHYDQYVKLAGEINPDIQLEKDGMDNTLIKDSYDWMPVSNSFFKKWNNTSGKAISKVRRLQRDAINASFYPVREVDRGTKVLATLAISDQFLNGRVPGFPLEKVQKMSDKEKADRTRSIVQQAIDNALTASATEDKSPLEKNKITSFFTRYFTDRRSGFNTIMAQIDKAKGAVRRGNNSQAARQILTMGLATGISAAFISLVRHDEDSILKNLLEVKNEEDAEEFALDMAWNFVTAPIDQTLSYVPFVDNIKYQSELKVRSDYRNVSTPLMGVGSDIAAGIVIMKDILDAGLQGETKDLNKHQRKLLLTNLGYIAGGAPTNSIYKAIEALDNRYVNQVNRNMKQNIMELHEKIDTYIEKFGDDPEAQSFIEGIKEYKKELPQYDSDVKNIIPENTKETLKKSLSEGKWNKFDPDTGAAGIYQFTEKRWNEIAKVNPELGLTENGRVSKDPSQQEKAMNWEIQDSTRGLLTYEIPVNEENLLGIHKFGFDNFAAIYESKDNEKLSDAIGEEAKNPVFKNFDTVKSLKDYLSREIRKAK